MYLHEELYRATSLNLSLCQKYTLVWQQWSAALLLGWMGEGGGRVFLWETSGTELHIVFSFQSLNLRILVKSFGQE